MPTWAEHFDVVQGVLVLCIGLIGWFTVRTLSLVDRNQEELFRRMQTLEKDFYMLKGEHEANQVHRKVI